MTITNLLHYLPQSKEKAVILFSILGFILTGILAYPYCIHSDQGIMGAEIVAGGGGTINNWQGWYFPLLWQVLYHITGVERIIGVFINLVYWTGITLLYTSLFDVKEKPRWHYFLFAWFPGALLFVTNITNNTLMFVYMLMGFALYFYFCRRKRSLWVLALSMAFFIQCVFVRREALLTVVPLCLLLLFCLCHQKIGILKSALLSLLAVSLTFGSVLFAEKRLTSRLPNYDAFDAVTVTGLTDMAAVTCLSGEMKLPSRLFPNEEAREQCHKELLKRFGEFRNVMFYDVRLLRPVVHYTGSKSWQDLYIRTRLTRDELFEFYKNNIGKYIYYRAEFASCFLWCTTHMGYITPQNYVDYLGYHAPQPSVIHLFLAFFFPRLVCFLYFFFILSFSQLFFDYKKWHVYPSTNEKILVYGMLLIVAASWGMYFVASVWPQWRYVYTLCMIQYFIFFYAADQMWPDIERRFNLNRLKK